MDKVSVIMPIYNTAPYLLKSIGSLVGQTHQNMEIILIDDGSTDESAQICKAFAAEDPRVVFIQQANSGVSSARNKGLEVMTGDYLAFLDSDDWFDLNAMENMLKEMQQNQADVVYCNSWDETEEGANLRVCYVDEGLVEAKRLVKEMLCYCDEQGQFTGYFFSLWNKMFCVKALRQLPGGIKSFDPKLRILEDGVWLMKHIPFLNKGVLTAHPYHHRLLRSNSAMNDFEKKYQTAIEYIDSFGIIMKALREYGNAELVELGKERYFASIRNALRRAYVDEAFSEMKPIIERIDVRYHTEVFEAFVCETFRMETSRAWRIGRRLSQSRFFVFLYNCRKRLKDLLLRR